MKFDPTVDIWVMPKVRGLAGVLGSGLSLIAAGIAALVLVSVLLAFNGWPTNASSGTVPRLIAATTSTQARVPTLVIGGHARTPTPPARRVAQLHAAPVTRAHVPSSAAPIYSDASRPAPPVSLPPVKKILPPQCVGATCGAQPPALPSQVTQIIDTGTKNANSLGQVLNDTVGKTTQTAGGVLNDVSKTVSKSLGGH